MELLFQDKMPSLFFASSEDDILATRYTLREHFYGALCGICCFPAVLASLQLFLFAPLFITPKRGTLGKVAGLLSVTTASISALWLETEIKSQLARKRVNAATLGILFWKRKRSCSELTVTNSLEYYVVFVILSILTFKSLGGKLTSVLPSHLFYPGAFSYYGIPVKSKGTYASRKEKVCLDEIGKQFGCHSCGRRNMLTYFADHQPPNKISTIEEEQMYYPQCQPCSSQQGNALVHVNNCLLQIQTHVTVVRLYHLWIPFPTIVSCLNTLLQEYINNGNLSTIWTAFFGDVSEDVLFLKQKLTSLL